MKIKSLILCFMVFVTESIVAQQGDLFINKDGSIVVKGNIIFKDTSGFYIIPQSERMELSSMGRKQNPQNSGPVIVSYDGVKSDTLGKFATFHSFSGGKKLILAPDTITEVFWGKDTLKLKLQSPIPTENEPVNIICDLELKNATIILTGRNLPIINGAFVNNSKDTIIVKSLKLETPYRDKRDVIVTQIGDTITQLYKAEGQSLLLSESKSLFSIQPGTKIQIAWGDRIWVIDSNTHSPRIDLPVEYLSIIVFLLLIVTVFGWKYFRLIMYAKQIKKKLSNMEKEISSIMSVEDGSDSKCRTDSEPSQNESIKEIISSLGTKIERLKYPDYIALNHFMDLCENREEIKKTLDNRENEDCTFENILDRLEEKLLNFNSIDHVVEKSTREEDPQQKEDVEKYPHDKCIEIQLDKKVDDTRDNVRLESDVNNKEVETLIEKIATRLEELVKIWMPVKGVLDNLSQLDSELKKNAKDQLALLEIFQEKTNSAPIQNQFGDKTVEEINTIINAVEGLIGKCQKKTSEELEAAIESSIIKRISDRIQLDEECEKYACLKNLIDSIKKSDNADKLTSGLLLKLYDVCKELKTLTQADKDKKAVEANIVNEIKKQYENLFKVELFSDTPLNAIKNFVSQVKDAVNQKDTKISNLNADIEVKKQIVEEAQRELSNNQSALKHIYQSYANFIVSAFEQIEKNIEQSCNAQGEFTPLVRKIHGRIISNDFCGLNEFVKKMKEIASEGTDIDKLKKEMKFCLKNPSWVDILAQMYLYIQVPVLAHKLTTLGLDTTTVNKAFGLTEFVMNIIGIELQYPKLFIDTFDESNFDEESLSEIQDLVEEDISDLAGTRQGVIIDLLKVGYSENGEIKRKAGVVRFN